MLLCTIAIRRVCVAFCPIERLTMRITVESPITPTPRTLQAASLFDLEVAGFSRLSWDVDLPLADQPWNVGLITGPSGSGKSTIARRLFADRDDYVWNIDIPS